MQRGFRNPLQEEGFVFFLATVAGAKSMERYYRASAPYPSGTENVLENEDEEVDLRDRQNPPSLR